MALLASILERSLDNDLSRVSDPESRFLAARKTLDRFLRTLPIGSNISKMFENLNSIAKDLEEEKVERRKNKSTALTETFNNSTVYLINRRENELKEKVQDYCDEKIKDINIAAGDLTQEIIEQKEVLVRPGIASVPKFAKTVESEISTSVSFLTDKTKLIDNEITVKENILSELNKNNVSNERIEFLWKNNENLTKQMEEEKRKFRIWKIAKMTEEYLKTMNKDEKVVKKEDTIKMFIAGIGDEIFDDIDYSIAVSDPKDSQNARVSLELIKDFGIKIRNKEYQQAAELAISNHILLNLHSFKRITESQSKNSLNAGIWFATVMFQSGRKFSIDFLLASLEICFESKMADYIIPNWHSYGVLLPHRNVAKWLVKCGQYAYASDIYLKLEMYFKCAQLLSKRNQFYQLVQFYHKKYIDYNFLSKIFYEKPNSIIGKALYENHSDSFGELMLNLVTRGFAQECCELFLSFEMGQQDFLVYNDEITTPSEWSSILFLINDEEVKSKIISQRSIKLAIEQENIHQKDQFDFYN